MPTVPIILLTLLIQMEGIFIDTMIKQALFTYTRRMTTDLIRLRNLIIIEIPENMS